MERYAKWALLSPYPMVALLLILALALRLIGIGDAPPRTDDLYNFIAARSWAENGTLAMADGVYTRTKYYSIVTAWLLEAFGPSLAVARVLAAVGGAILVASTALWVRKVGNPMAAWIAGVLLCISYTSVTWSQIVRFYTWHAVAMFVLAIAVYAMVTGHRSLRPVQWLLYLTAAAISLVVGLYLQAITVIMIVALAAWAGLFFLFTGQFNFILSSRNLLLATLFAAAAGAMLAFTVGRPILLSLWMELRSAAAWSQDSRDNWIFYFDQLTHQLNWLFFLLPLAFVASLGRYATAAIFCALISVACIGLHTIAGMKAVRYVIYLFPFFFAIWGLALSVVVPAFARYVWRTVPASPGLLRPAVVVGAFAAVAAVSVVIVADFRMTAAALVRAIRTGTTFQPLEYGFGRDQVFWEPYLPQLRSLQKAGLFVVSDSNRAIYYLGDYDVLLSKTELSDIGTKEFLLDPRTGKRNISSGASIRAVIECYPKGAILATEAQWRSPYVLPEAADVIEQNTTQVPLPEPLNMRAYRWDHATAADVVACQPIYEMIGKSPGGAMR